MRSRFSAGRFKKACFANPAAWIAADLFLIPCYRRIMRTLHGRLLPGTEEYTTAESSGETEAWKAA